MVDLPFLSVAVLIPGLLSFVMKNKGAGTRFFVGTGRILVSVALLLACILSQRGLEPEKEMPIQAPPIASQTIPRPQVVDTSPPSVMECVMNGKRYHSDLHLTW